MHQNMPPPGATVPNSGPAEDEVAGLRGGSEGSDGAPPPAPEPYQLSIKRGVAAIMVHFGAQILVAILVAFYLAMMARLAGVEQASADANLPLLTVWSLWFGGALTLWWIWSNIRKFGPGFKAQLGWRPSRLPLGETIGLMVVVFLGTRVLAGVYASLVLAGGGDPVSGQAEQLIAQAGDGGSPLLVVGMMGATMFVAPVLEELVFRGYLQSALARRLPAWGAIAITAAAFASVHGSLMLWPIYFMIGAGLGWVFDRTGSLGAAIGLHMGNNIIFSLVALMG